jgi:peptidoglycan/xylan/chitin deacetylase (PgdA/CDA1 family)
MIVERLTYSHRRHGLDHDWFVHQSTFKRAPLVWPGGKPLALWITVPVEFSPLDAPALPVRPLGGLDRGYPDFWSYSNRDYGTRIGVYRIMRVLDSLGLRATAVVNATAATRYPRVIDEMVRRDWEISANGVDMGHVTTDSSSWRPSASSFREREKLWPTHRATVSPDGILRDIRSRPIRSCCSQKAVLST